MPNHHTPPPRPEDHLVMNVSWMQAPADIDEPPKLVASCARIRQGEPIYEGLVFSATILDMPLAVPGMDFLTYVRTCLGTCAAVLKVQERAVYWTSPVRKINGILIPPTLAGRSFRE